ncbi:MAG: condensation domain-containing protein, partial [Candidatus Angelobacter sp.]
MSVTNVEDVQRAEPMKLANVEDIYPMSPMQQGLLFHCLYEPGSGMYLLEIGGHIEAGLNVPAFRRAWEEVIRRHAVLRTAFLWEGLSKPMQVVRKNVELPWREEDWRDLSDSEQKERWKNFLLENRKQEFDFKQAPLIRLALMRTGEQSYYFAWTGHHIVADGWCWQIVMGEALTLYDAYREGRTVQLKQPRLYRDYISWLQKQDESKAEAYWRETLQGFSKPTRLGMERDGELKEGENDHGVVQSHLNWAVSEKLEELARDQMVTLSTVVQAAWAVVLSRYSGEKDVAFGATVSGRSGDPGFEETVGLFINTLPVRVQVDEEERISAYLQRLQQLNATALDFEYSPLLKVQEWSDVLRGMPLFENIVVFENYPVDAAIQKGAGSSLKFSEISTVESNSYPLALVVRPGTELSLICHHNCRWFDEASVERLMGHLMSVLQAIAKNPDQRVGELSLLTPEEREQVVVEWNRTGEEYPARCVHELMEEEAARKPEAVALEIGGRQISYGELNERANQVAHYLRKKGVGPEVRVGVSVGRSLELVVGLLGVLKAGGAYVPLDPEHPVERLRFMMEDAGVEVLLTEERLLGEMAEGEEDKIAEQRRD